MIGYVTIGTNDYDRARKFYDAVLAALGGKRTMEFDGRIQGYGNGSSPVMFAVAKPYNEKSATAGNGTMVALVAPSREAVDRVHADALKHGASDEGAPGLRGDTFYGAYFRDPDGNKICVFYTGQ